MHAHFDHIGAVTDVAEVAARRSRSIRSNCR
jgi:glyoxylase-like metal-dependent hydrolase (beta-lactamase superfamily II)